MNKLRPARHSFREIVRQEHLVFIVLVFVFYYAWSLILPPNVAPDETMRYKIPAFIYQYGALPHGADPLVRDPLWGISYGFTPILPQIISAGFMKIAGLFTADEFALLMAARMVSVLCATATVWIAVKISGELLKGAFRWLFVILIAFLPQFSFLGSYVNNDCFAVFSTAVIFYAWVTGLKYKWPVKSCALLGIGMGLCAMSYYNAYGWLLASIILFFVSNLAMDRARWKDRRFRVKLYVAAGLFAAIAAWWFIRSYIIYDGDFLGLNITEHYKELYAIDELKPSNAPTVQEQGVSVVGMLWNMKWAATTYYSFIGIFGSMSVLIPGWIYKIYAAVFLAGMAGCVVRFIRFIRERDVNKGKKWLMGLCMVLTMIIPVALSIYYSYTSDFQPQGRYIMSLLIPLMLFTTIGIETILRWIFKDKTAAVFAIILAAGLTAVAAYVFFGVYLPLYT